VKEKERGGEEEKQKACSRTLSASRVSFDSAERESNTRYLREKRKGISGVEIPGGKAAHLVGFAPEKKKGSERSPGVRREKGARALCKKEKAACTSLLGGEERAGGEKGGLFTRRILRPEVSRNPPIQEGAEPVFACKKGSPAQKGVGQALTGGRKKKKPFSFSSLRGDAATKGRKSSTARERRKPCLRRSVNT